MRLKAAAILGMMAAMSPTITYVLKNKTEPKEKKNKYSLTKEEIEKMSAMDIKEKKAFLKSRGTK